MFSVSSLFTYPEYVWEICMHVCILLSPFLCTTLPNKVRYLQSACLLLFAHLSFYIDFHHGTDSTVLQRPMFTCVLMGLWASWWKMRDSVRGIARCSLHILSWVQCKQNSEKSQPSERLISTCILLFFPIPIIYLRLTSCPIKLIVWNGGFCLTV